jgi:predicted transposase YdaD
VAKRPKKDDLSEEDKPGAKEGKRKPKEFDATFKDLAQDSPTDFLSAFDAPPDTTVEVLNVDLSTVTTEADLVFGIGKPLREIVHIDAQAGPDADLHRSVLVYNALLHRLYHVPVHSIVILLRRKAQHRNLTGKVRYTARPERGRMDFSYEIIALWERPAEELLTGPLGLVPLAPLGKLPEGISEEAGLAAVTRRVVERLLRDASAGRAKKLLTAAFILTGLRVSREDARKLFRGATAMHESDTYQAILDEGEVRGLQNTLLRLGRIRFGAPKPATRQAIQAITDIKRLRHLTERLLRVSTWEELLQTP